MIACSKKCKKVAKFAYLLKKNNENQILKTFETMLRKRMQKNLEQAQLQPRVMVAKSIVGLYAKPHDTDSFVSQSALSPEAQRQSFGGVNRQKSMRASTK